MLGFRRGHRHSASSISSFFASLGNPSTPRAPTYSEVPARPSPHSADELPSPPQTPSKSGARLRRKAPWKFTALILCVCVVGLGYLSVQSFRRPPRAESTAERIPAPSEHVSESEVEVAFGTYDTRRWVRGEPTESFRDNLLPRVKYITSWPCAGWTNDVMALVHMLYLAQLTERVPILPAFAPSHIGQAAGQIPFGDVFDLQRLSEETHMPILEWRDIKQPNSAVVDSIGCWSAWIGGGQSDGRPRDSYVPPVLRLDISYTSTPYSMKVYGEGDSHLLYGRLMQLGFPSGRREALQQNSPLPAPQSGTVLEPDEHLMCFDYLYYTSLDRNFEWYYDWSPQWRLIGKHLRWAPALQAVSEQYLQRHFGTEGELPKFISVHARRGDFGHSCPGDNFSCLPSIEQLQQRVEEIRHEIFKKDGLYVEQVLVLSDETDPAWWQEVRDNGWGWIDHVRERTAEKHGPWYVPLLDAVFQSAGVGFIGTDSSTMSLVAALRVRDWQDGPVTYLTWKGL
ncbi:hypothetical protein CALVIDRAFT_534075 [Calocera viscosa TUFC12733]|uniref:Uncharacterized protein n=1 Tax=Calocera viscosa (strain TUFC12733) TaxID=1330018 RepID=A0A167QDD8_CALVF|nr:hypothetical protein CALVIDRAFT_534075 [Calocera viscosa TUFC12733]